MAQLSPFILRRYVLHLPCLLMLGLACFVGSAGADDIEFVNGKMVEEADVLSIEAGVIRFEYGVPPKELSTKLTNVVSIRKSSASFRLLSFEEFTIGRDKGRLITIEMETGRKRLREPLVRLYVLMQDEKGERELHLYQNQRSKDPTAFYDLAVVNANAWSPARFFVEVKHKAIAWHLEIWQDGVLSFDQEIGRREFQRKWWLQQKPDRSSTLEVPKGKDVPQVLGDAEGVRAVIRSARVYRGLDREQAQVDLEWALDTAKEQVELPEATFYYVTETENGERKLHREKVESNAGKKVVVKGNVVRKGVVELDKGVELAGGGTLFTSKDKVESVKLLYWRFAVHVGAAELAVRESPNTSVRRSLGDKWWLD